MGGERVRELEAAIRRHRDSWLSGDDKCWKDNEELYRLLPEGFSPPARDTRVELALCQKYVESCHHPAVEYVSPQRRIESLEAGLRAAAALLERAAAGLGREGSLFVHEVAEAASLLRLADAGGPEGYCVTDDDGSPD